MRVSPEERERIVREYARKRMRAETKGVRGAQAALARALDVSKAHVSECLADPPTSHPGRDMLTALGNYWRLGGYAGLEAQALVEAGHYPVNFQPLQSAFPELTAAIAYAMGFRPLDFLLAARHEAEAYGEDRPRREWSAWLEWKWGEWQRLHPPPPASPESDEKVVQLRKREKPKGRGAT